MSQDELESRLTELLSEEAALTKQLKEKQADIAQVSKELLSAKMNINEPDKNKLVIKFEIQDAKCQGRPMRKESITVTNDIIVIGSSETCNLQISDHLATSKHSVIELSVQGGVYQMKLIALGSQPGTSVKNKPINGRYDLQLEEEFTVGNCCRIKVISIDKATLSSSEITRGRSTSTTSSRLASQLSKI